MSDSALITGCCTAPELFPLLRECADNYGVEKADDHWPHNCISRRSVIFECGNIAFADAQLEHRHDEAEFFRCKELAEEACDLMCNTPIGFGTEATGAYFDPYFAVANVGSPLTEITPDSVRSLFNGTIYPPATINVQPLSEESSWWSDQLLPDAAPETLRAWRDLIVWFAECSELSGPRFVQIGQDPLDAEQRNSGCVFPLLVIGLTGNGSAVGLVGHVVHT